MARAFIVWNADRSEGVVFRETGDDAPGLPSAEQDAQQASTGRHGVIGSALAEAFYETYGEDADEPLPIETVDL